MPAPLQKGTLTAASQTLQEDYFARTVILIIHHSAEDGSMGQVLNRPMGHSVQIDDAGDELMRFAESELTGGGTSQLFSKGAPSTAVTYFTCIDSVTSLQMETRY